MTMFGADQNQACAFGQLFFAILVEIQAAHYKMIRKNGFPTRPGPAPLARRGRRAKRHCVFQNIDISVSENQYQWYPA
jgi:hypothetical protein